MEPNLKPKISVKDLFLNLGAIVALYTVVIGLINLLFAVINTAYPQVVNGYDYYGTQSISFPVALLIIFFPIFVFLMWLLEKSYMVEPERKNVGVRKWLSYITLFLAGLATASDLVTVLYYFIDGQDLTTGFLLKVLAVLVVAVSVFVYYVSDIRGKLTSAQRKMWSVFAVVIILGSIVWGFMVLGSPRTQRLYKYDDQKTSVLQEIKNQTEVFYSNKGSLPTTLEELSGANYVSFGVDPQTQKPYDYKKTGNLTYKVCAEFNKASKEATAPNIYARPIGYTSWVHPEGLYCFDLTINPSLYSKVPVKI